MFFCQRICYAVRVLRLTTESHTICKPLMTTFCLTNLAGKPYIDDQPIAI